MATPVLVNVRPERHLPAEVTPLLEAGDRLSRDEFESRYERMPHLKKAELSDRRRDSPVANGCLPPPKKQP